MFMENKDFYPTPKPLINKMLSGLDLHHIVSILEPSAGKGDIIEVLEEKEKIYSSRYSFDIDCIENDNNLIQILKSKNYRVIYNDFLTFNTMKEYDLIIMNPPFSDGCKHLLKAIELQKRNGGAIICLLNAETLKNECNNDRITLNKLLKEYNATIEYIENAFTNAERKTFVEIALIKIQMPKVKKESFIFDSLRQTEKEREEDIYINNNQLVENDFFKAIIDQYNMEIKAGIKLIKEYNAMQPHILSSFEKDKETRETIQTGGCILSLDIANNKNKYGSNLSINGYIKEVRGKYWKALFESPKFIGKLTENLKREYYNKIEELKNYDFSLYNIRELRIDMSKKVSKGIEETIINLFDKMSNKYSYYDEMSNNIHYYNGWSTNKAYIVNKKVILPLNAYDTYWGRYEPTSRCLNVLQKLKDMEKCFNYLDGGLTESIDIEKALKFAEKFGETKNIELKYFTVTFYKKGTCHITFTNSELLKKFNIFGSQHKGWLPPCYGKKTYKNMSSKEKEVITNFEGEQEYNKTMTNTSYYLFDCNNINLLENKKA